MIPKPKDSNQLFAQLRTFASTFQCLHELHVEHFKKWPLAIDPNVEKSTTQVDFDNKQLVSLWLFQEKPVKRPKDYQHRLQEFCKGVRFLLGESWKVKVVNADNNKIIFDSESIHIKTKTR